MNVKILADDLSRQVTCTCAANNELATMTNRIRIEVFAVYVTLLIVGVASHHKTWMGIATLIAYPDSEAHDLLKGVLRIQDDTPIYVARRIVADDISKLERDIDADGFEKWEYSRLMELLALYEVGHYWNEGSEMIERALREVPEDSVTHEIATNMQTYFASGLSDATEPTLKSDAQMLLRQSAGLLALIAIATLYCTVSLSRRSLTERETLYVKVGYQLVVSIFLGMIYLVVYY